MKKIIIFLFFILAIYGARTFFHKGFDMTIDGDQVVLSRGKRSLVAQKQGRLVTETYLLVGGSVSGSGWGCFLPVIPLGQAEQLAQEYGDFRRCGSLGASEGQRSTQVFTAIGARADIRKELDQVIKLSGRGKNVIIEITYEALSVVSEKSSAGYPVIRTGDFPRDILVRSIQVIDPDRTF